MSLTVSARDAVAAGQPSPDWSGQLPPRRSACDNS